VSGVRRPILKAEQAEAHCRQRRGERRMRWIVDVGAYQAGPTVEVKNLDALGAVAEIADVVIARRRDQAAMRARELDRPGGEGRRQGGPAQQAPMPLRLGMRDAL